jgi:hypothetical protein
MKKAVQFFLIFLLTIPFNSSAQNGLKDGTSLADLQLNFTNMMQLRARFPSVSSLRAVNYVPVCFHLVAKDDGTGRVNEARVLDILCSWNQFYARNNVDIQFYIKDNFKYIDKTIIYNSPNSFNGTNLLRAQKCSDALNIFFVNAISTNSTEIINFQYSNRPSETEPPYSNDWILLQNNAAAATPDIMWRVSATYFGLVPTYFGSECLSFLIPRDTLCVPESVTCSNRTIVELERVARTGARANCSQKGDGFCDTQAEYDAFGISIDRGCHYQGKIKDADCVRLAPDLTNVMSIGYYEATCAPLIFSTEQKNALRNNYFNLPERAYIRSNNTPSLADLIQPTQFSPANGTTTTYFNNIYLDWENTVGAIGYIVEISRFDPRFGTGGFEFSFHTKTSDFNMNAANMGAGTFLQGRKFYWRVRPYSAYKVCNTVSGFSSFTTGIINGGTEIDGVSGIVLLPNPINKSPILNLKMTNLTAFEGRIEIFDLAGKLIQSEKRDFKSGDLLEEINVENLGNGLFILKIVSGKSSISKRFIVQK